MVQNNFLCLKQIYCCLTFVCVYRYDNWLTDNEQSDGESKDDYDYCNGDDSDDEDDHAAHYDGNDDGKLQVL